MKREELVLVEDVTSHNNGGKNVACEIPETLMEKSFQVNQTF